MSSPTTTTRPPLAARVAARLDWRSNIIYIAFVVVFVLFAIFLGGDGFLSPNNMLNIVRQTATISIMAVAMTFVIATAEIDLSVGSIAGLASVVTAMTTTQFGLVPGIIAGLAAGAVIGAINGGLVALLKIPSFLVTLGMLGLAAGLAQWITSSAPQPITDRLYVMIFGGGDFGPVPGLLVWTVVAVAVGWVVMNRTGFGRKVLATGGNPTAAAYTGIRTARIKFSVLLISGIAAAVAGMLYAGRLESGRFQWGQGDELTVIAAVILGGTSLFGGRGAIIGTLFGSLFMGLINNGLILAGLDVAQQQVVRGAIIIAAVALSRKK
ncbi:MAG: ABC transporter permease [Microbacterium sp. SCN 70-200]|uniref:ABC transporter permease n=1 Tax=unclassified Microbacterium TaxID=2609290 RepID=UPI000869BA08|nr:MULTISPECIES: ABC transporter permease [unclassified Microbacterium]MBN9215315.1 ABC transporter permease [Microbacterium sp.]ODT42714.1 MAG: ABC transporter permease [Microbacterium sp. SCN 70-200]OJV79943.1 MAG: ABC transporter permease [Microbacterium sp. 70-16]